MAFEIAPVFMLQIVNETRKLAKAVCVEAGQNAQRSEADLSVQARCYRRPLALNYLGSDPNTSYDGAALSRNALISDANLLASNFFACSLMAS